MGACAWDQVHICNHPYEAKQRFGHKMAFVGGCCDGQFLDLDSTSQEEVRLHVRSAADRMLNGVGTVLSASCLLHPERKAILADELMKYALRKADKFSVITEILRPLKKKKYLHDEKICCLKPFLKYQIVGIRKWSNNGTQSSRTVMNIYECSNDVADVLNSMGNLLCPQCYDLPEDICFYKGNYTWLATVSHED